MDEQIQRRIALAVVSAAQSIHDLRTSVHVVDGNTDLYEQR